MTNADRRSIIERMDYLCSLYQNQPDLSLRTGEIAEQLGVHENTARVYIDELGRTGRLCLKKDGHYWKLSDQVSPSLPDFQLKSAEAAALFLAARLFSQIHDEQNIHVLNVLAKLATIFPSVLAKQQQEVISLAQERQQDIDRSKIFDVLTNGWIHQREVRLIYTTMRGKRFTTIFHPYTLEPSAIGRTIYVIGYSEIARALRTFKFERIEHAELLSSHSFTIPETFDLKKLLQNTWGVLSYEEGEEPIKILLHFSQSVTKRVKEAVWHPTQRITDIPSGCEMELWLNNTVEIEPWVRNWGGDCEVREPADLRARVINHVRRQVDTYQIATLSQEENSYDDFFDAILDA